MVGSGRMDANNRSGGASNEQPMSLGCLFKINSGKRLYKVPNKQFTAYRCPGKTEYINRRTIKFANCFTVLFLRSLIGLDGIDNKWFQFGNSQSITMCVPELSLDSEANTDKFNWDANRSLKQRKFAFEFRSQFFRYLTCL